MRCRGQKFDCPWSQQRKETRLRQILVPESPSVSGRQCSMPHASPSLLARPLQFKPLRPLELGGDGGISRSFDAAILGTRLAGIRAAVDELNTSLGIAGGRRNVQPQQISGPPEVRLQRRIACMRATIAEMRNRKASPKGGHGHDEESCVVQCVVKDQAKRVRFAVGPWKDKYGCPDGHPNREGIHKPQSLGREFRTCHEPQEIHWTELSELITVLQRPPEGWGEKPWDPAKGYQWSIRRIQEQKGVVTKMRRGRPYATPQPKVQARKHRERQWRKWLVSTVISSLGAVNKPLTSSPGNLSAGPHVPGEQQV